MAPGTMPWSEERPAARAERFDARGSGFAPNSCDPHLFCRWGCTPLEPPVPEPPSAPGAWGGCSARSWRARRLGEQLRAPLAALSRTSGSSRARPRRSSRGRSPRPRREARRRPADADAHADEVGRAEVLHDDERSPLWPAWPPPILRRTSPKGRSSSSCRTIDVARRDLEERHRRLHAAPDSFMNVSGLRRTAARPTSSPLVHSPENFFFGTGRRGSRARELVDGHADVVPVDAYSWPGLPSPTTSSMLSRARGAHGVLPRRTCRLVTYFLSLPPAFLASLAGAAAARSCTGRGSGGAAAPAARRQRRARQERQRPLRHRQLRSASISSARSFSGATTTTTVCSAGRRTLDALGERELAGLDESPMSRSVTSISMMAGIFSGRQRTGSLRIDLAKDAARDEADSPCRAAERDLDVDRLVELHLDEVGVHEVARQGVERVVAHHDGELLAAVDAQLDDRVLPVLALEDAGEALRERPRAEARCAALAVRDRGDLARSRRRRRAALLPARWWRAWGWRMRRCAWLLTCA